MFYSTGGEPGEHELERDAAKPPWERPLRAIGKIHTIVGSFTVARAGAAVVQLAVGDPVFEGDIVETGADSSVSIHFSDGAVFELSACARMVLSEFAGDGASSSSALFVLSKGAIAFMAGRAAKGGLWIDTPIARIRGSRGGGIVSLAMAALTFAALKEVRADDLPIIDDERVELPHGTFELVTKELVPQVIVVDDPWKTVVLQKVGSIVDVNRVANSFERMDDLGQISRDTFAIFRQGQQDPYINHQQRAAVGTGETRADLSISDFSDVPVVTPANLISPDSDPEFDVVPTNFAPAPSYIPEVPIVIPTTIVSSSPISPPATIILAAAAQLTFIDTSAPDDFDPVSGTLLVTATNTNAPLTFGIAGGTADLSFSGYNQSLTVAYGTLYLSSTTGDYAFIPNDTTINALTAPTAANFTLMASDGTLSTQQTVAFALDGANDAPTLQPVTGPTYTDASAAPASSAASLELAVTNTSEPGVFTAVTGTLMAADVDLPAQTLTYGIVDGTADNSLSGYNVSLTGTYGKLFVNSGTGNYEFVPNETAIKALPATTAIENFTVTVSDGSLSAERIFTVTVNGVHDAPTLTVSDASGNEDTPIALSIASALTDTDGSETLSITIAGVPSGATLSHGTNNGGGNWTVTPAQLAGLTITPPANSDADFALTVTATSKETSSGNTASTVDTIHVTVDAVADAPTLTVSDASGNEDTPIALSIASALTDIGGSETLSITISGVPTGAMLSAGIDNGGGSWTVTPSQLAGLTITPPANSDADFILTVTATSKETNGGNTASTVGTIHVTVNAVVEDQFPTQNYGAWTETGDDFNAQNGSPTQGEFTLAHDPLAPDANLFQIRLSDDDNEGAVPDLLSR
ncbi:MAG: VCBS domain-containing protein, partial [Rhodoplanes sp.]